MRKRNAIKIENLVGRKGPIKNSGSGINLDAKKGFSFGSDARTSESVFVNHNITHGKFFIDTAITESSANTFIQDLEFYVETQMVLSPELRKPVQLHINTPGGCVDQGLAIMNALRACPLDVIAFATGPVYSMGIPIMLCCGQIVAYEFSRFMIHSGSIGIFGEYLTAIERLEDYVKLSDQLNEFIVDRTDLSKEDIDEITNGKKDKMYSAKEAKEVGLVDEVIGDYDDFMKMKQQEASEMQDELSNALLEVGKELELDADDLDAVPLIAKKEEQSEAPCACGAECSCGEVELEIPAGTDITKLKPTGTYTTPIIEDEKELSKDDITEDMFLGNKVSVYQMHINMYNERVDRYRLTPEEVLKLDQPNLKKTMENGHGILSVILDVETKDTMKMTIILDDKDFTVKEYIISNETGIEIK